MAPTLVVHGTDDLFCPTANGVELAARIRHAYFVEFREQAGPLVVGFLRDHPLA